MKDSELLSEMAELIACHKYTHDIDHAYIWLMRMVAKVKACEDRGCWDKQCDPRDGMMGAK